MPNSKRVCSLLVILILTALVPGLYAQSQVPLYDPPLLALSPQGDKLAVAVRGRPGQQSSLSIVDTASGTALSVFQPFEYIVSMVWSPDNSSLAAGGFNSLRVYSDPAVSTVYIDLSQVPSLITGIDSYFVGDLAWDSFGTRLTFSLGSLIFVYNASTQQSEAYLDSTYVNASDEPSSWDLVNDIEFLESNSLIFATRGGTTYIYSLTEQQVTRYFQPFLVTLYSPQVTGTALSHSRTRYAVAERYANRVYIWDIESNVGVEDDFWAEPNSAVFEGHGDVYVRAIAWRHDDAVVASLSEDFKLRFWDPNTGQQYAETTLPPNASTNQIVWSADGSEVLYVTMDAELESVPVSGVSVPPPSTPTPAGP